MLSYLCFFFFIITPPSQGFATSISIVISCIVSIYLFNFVVTRTLQGMHRSLRARRGMLLTFRNSSSI